MTLKEESKFLLDHGIKKCSMCGEMKDISEFARSEKGRYQSMCKIHYNEYQRKKHKERIKLKILGLWMKK